MNNEKNDNLPIQIPKHDKKYIKNIKSESNNHKCIEISQYRSIIDNENKTDKNNKGIIDDPNKQLESTIIRDNSYNINASNLQAINNNFPMDDKSNSKTQEESTKAKSLFYVELKDYFSSKLFKRKSTQLLKYEQFQTVLKDILSIEFILEGLNDISQLKNKLQPGGIGLK